MEAFPWIEFGKMFGFPALCLAALALMVWGGFRWFATKIAEPLCDDLRAAVRAVAPAAVKMRDDVAEVKDTTARIEQRQNEHFKICATGRP